jgi:acetolactate synthase-1/2/3 large subunit
MDLKVSDQIADFLAEQNIRHVFGIVGAGNAHIFDSIAKKGFTEIVCVHHEQAACMAMQTYYRTCGTVTASILTTGGGSVNGVTGVLSAWMDSIPGLVISGNENSKFTTEDNPLRIWGVQGFDSVDMVKKVTKYAKRVTDPKQVRAELQKAYTIARRERPGPCWLDIPMNVQASFLKTEELEVFEQGVAATIYKDAKPAGDPNLQESVEQVLQLLAESQRPLLWLGHGIRQARAMELIEPLLDLLKVPALVSWAGKDMIDSNHSLVFGSAGVYGQRCANFILQNCDFLLTIGTRLAIPQVGYDLSEFARAAVIAVVDIDPEEARKHGDRIKLPIWADAGEFISALMEAAKGHPTSPRDEWLRRCNLYKSKYPWVGPEHQDKDGYINSYSFMGKLSEYLKPDQVIVTDMGTALLSGHQSLRTRKGQRLMTSTGLGEMGYGLPGAIGASFARDKGEVLCLNCDGGMMMNLQELQTVVHHRLPIKLIVFNNDGYLMIKHTQKALFGGRYSGTDEKSGVSCPDFGKLAHAFGLPAFQIRTWDDFDRVVPQVQANEGPLICEVFMHPEQLFVPKLSLAPQKDGSLISPPLEDLSPFLPREELKENMLIGIHPKSEKIGA